MNRMTCAVNLLALVAAIACAPAQAQTGACMPLVSAMTLLATTPNHQHITETAAYKPGPSQSEVVETGTTRYLRVIGRWHSHSYDAKAEAAEIGNAMQASKAICTNAGSADVDGQAVTLFAVHKQSDDAVIVQRIWIGANGLPLRQVIDIDVGGALGKSRREFRYDYADVQPPKI
ncbi:hypothetical protein [Rudaea cellulosilytica]|uniref:hypothetical protein n=1 Tax=Rudaea cellulosilytica TaxID=540746 RepID=UPI00039D7F65|nr:hypothetical protein [Rudaea cellulosilytica]